jgi:hypothetical protein
MIVQKERLVPLLTDPTQQSIKIQDSDNLCCLVKKEEELLFESKL